MKRIAGSVKRILSAREAAAKKLSRATLPPFIPPKRPFSVTLLTFVENHCPYGPPERLMGRSGCILTKILLRWRIKSSTSPKLTETVLNSWNVIVSRREARS